MPDPLMLRDNPWFMEDMYAYGGDQSLNAPDPSMLNRDDSDMMRVVMSMMGSTGYLDYIKKLKKQREKAALGKPAAPPSPTPPPTPTPGSDIDAGIEAINERKKKPSDYGI